MKRARSALALSLALALALAPLSAAPDAIVFPPPGPRPLPGQPPTPAPAAAPQQLAAEELGWRTPARPGPLDRASAALLGVAGRLRALLAPGPADNLVLSPLSVAAALGQLLLGARGDTRQLLADLLAPPESPSRAGPGAAELGLDYHQQFKSLLALLEAAGAAGDGFELRLASSFFLQTGMPLRSEFRSALSDLYGADVLSLDFRARPEAALATMNAWVRQHTAGRISALLARAPPPATALLLANAVYFRGAWAAPFDSDLTVNGWFRAGPRQRVAVRFMRSHFPEMRFVDSAPLACRIAVLPYRNQQAAMYVVLPADPGADVRNFAARVPLERLLQEARAARPQPVTLVLPRMSLASSFSLKQPLSRFREQRRRPRPRRAAPEPEPEPEPEPAPAPAPAPNATASASLARPVVVGVPLRISGLEDPAAAPHKDVGKVHLLPVTGTGAGPRKSSPDKPYKPPAASKDSPYPYHYPKVVVSPNIYFPFDNSTGDPANGPRGASPEATLRLRTLAVGSGLARDEEVTTTKPFLSPIPTTSPCSVSVTASPSTTSAWTPVSASSASISTASSTSATPTSSQATTRAVSASSPSALGSSAAPHQVSSDALGPLPQPQATTPTPPPEPEALNPLAVRPGRPQPVGPPPPLDLNLELAGASSDRRFRVSDALHQVWLEVTETGTEAAAVTATTVDYSGDAKLLVVNRPFLFLVVHEPSGALLFWGSVSDPTGGAGVRAPLDAPAGARPSAPAPAVRARRL